MLTASAGWIDDSTTLETFKIDGRPHIEYFEPARLNVDYGAFASSHPITDSTLKAFENGHVSELGSATAPSRGGFWAQGDFDFFANYGRTGADP